MPGLAAVLVGEDPASQVYVRNKNKQTVEAGMNSLGETLPVDTSQTDLLAEIDTLNNDPAVNGILVQLPLPDQIDPHAVIDAIDPAKDVDGFHLRNVGLLATGRGGMVPCTPLGCLMMLEDRLGDLTGLNAVIVGRSNIVGKPMAQLLLSANCTVTIAHSRTADLPAVCREADILVAAVGRPQMIKGELDQAGGNRHRCRHQPCARRRRRQDAAGRRRCVRRRGKNCRRHNAGTRRRRADDHRLPAAQYAGRRLYSERD